MSSLALGVTTGTAAKWAKGISSGFGAIIHESSAIIPLRIYFS